MNPHAMTLTFENCESVTIPIKYINSFHIGGIKRSITYNKRNTNNQVRHEFTTDNAYILFNGAFGVSLIKTTCDELAYDRIRNHNDITHIDLTYTTHTESYSVEWPMPDMYYNNPRQSHSNHYDGLTVEIRPSS